METAEPPLKCPLEGVGEKTSGEAGADTKLLSLDLVLGGRGGRPRSEELLGSWSVSSPASELVYSMKLSSSRLEVGPNEILPWVLGKYF